jgi:putative Holliday junction resolvase
MSAAALTVEALAPQLPRKGRLIGVDLGTKTIGLALSDVERRIATPLETLKRVKFGRDAEALAARLREFDAVALVFGLPLALDGKDSPRAQATRAFVREYQRLHPTALAFWDERMSTAAVERDLIAQDVSRARRAEVIDKMAAAYILQGALDRLARLGAAEQRM